MRTRHWLATLMGGWMALAGVGTANAQPPGMPTNGNPDQAMMGMLPPPYNTSYGPTQPAYQGMSAPGYPPGAQAWPGVSPYMGPPVDSTVYQNGFWYNRILGGGRKYYSSVDALFGFASKPDSTLIGAEGVNPQTTDQISGLLTATGTTGTTGGVLGQTQFNQTTFTAGPSRSISGGGAAAGGGGGAGGAGGTGTPTIFPAFNTGILPSIPMQLGYRATFGWDNDDGSGFVVSGFALQRTQSNWGLYDPQLDINPNTEDYNPLLHLHAWFGLPLAGADTDNTSSPTTTTTGGGGLGTANDGAVIPYDMGVHITFSSRLAGANADWFFNPIAEGDKFKVRALAGGRYIRLQESFSFDGYDSGMGYTVSAAAGGAGGAGGGAAGGAGGAAGGGYLTPSAFTAPFNLPNVLHSTLTSATLSDMGGPEIGMRLDLGGKKFQFYTTTKVAALANVTQRSVGGFGIGNNFNITTVNGIVNTVPVMPNNPSLTAFNNSQTTTTMSPMFEQQFNIKMPIFSMIPYLGKMELFENASVTAGYTFLFIGDIYRPQNQIIWNQYPNAPQLNNTKSDYYNQMMNVGIEWNY